MHMKFREHGMDPQVINAVLERSRCLNYITKGGSDSAYILVVELACMICRWSQCGI